MKTTEIIDLVKAGNLAALEAKFARIEQMAGSNIAVRNEIFSDMVNEKDTSECTPLHYVTYSTALSTNDSIRCIHLLTGKGEDINARDNEGNTPLHAIAKNFMNKKNNQSLEATAELMDLLLTLGCKGRIKDNEGHTAMLYFINGTDADGLSTIQGTDSTSLKYFKKDLSVVYDAVLKKKQCILL
ncbi:MAG: hypothetical protein ACHP6I_02315 [Rickettsiales bacterium]